MPRSSNYHRAGNRHTGTKHMQKVSTGFVGNGDCGWRWEIKPPVLKSWSVQKPPPQQLDIKFHDEEISIRMPVAEWKDLVNISSGQLINKRDIKQELQIDGHIFNIEWVEEKDLYPLKQPDTMFVNEFLVWCQKKRWARDEYEKV